jgi:hypothetical protein
MASSTFILLLVINHEVMQKSDKYVGRGHYLDAGVKIAEVKLV